MLLSRRGLGGVPRRAAVVCVALLLGAAACARDEATTTPESSRPNAGEPAGRSRSDQRVPQPGADGRPQPVRHVTVAIASAQRFARCLRSVGIPSVERPTRVEPSSRRKRHDVEALRSDRAFSLASRACRRRLATTESRATRQARESWVQAIRRVARCMRSHGFDMPDPRPDSEGPMGYSLDTGLPGHVDPDTDPRFATANEQCMSAWGIWSARPRGP
jgi:hypothetical protein